MSSVLEKGRILEPFFKGTDRARAGTIVQDQPTRPFVDALI